MLDTADHCSYLYTGWSGSASGLSGLSTHAGCGFPHTGKTWCTPIFFTQKKNPDQVITSSIIECVFRNIFDSIYWKNHYKKIFKSQNTGKCFAGITFILKLILLYITTTTTSQKCNVDYLVLLLACWDTLNWENYFRSFSLSFCFQFIFSHTANKQEEEYSHWWSAPFFFSLYASMIYSSSQTNKEPTYMLETYACMFFPFSSTVQVLPLLIHRATYLLTGRHTFQMRFSFEQSMEKKFFSCILETTDFFLCSSDSKSYGNLWAKWINRFTFTA